MFHNLKDLKIGDIFFLTDNNIGKVEYKIYNIYKVYPEDISPIYSKNLNKKEVTLITCTVDSKQRIVVKALEK